MHVMSMAIGARGLGLGTYHRLLQSRVIWHDSRIGKPVSKVVFKHRLRLLELETSFGAA